MRVFGPVPSRRLGRSLGVNNIPAKECTYSCVYCQIGAGFDLKTKRRPYFDPIDTAGEVQAKLWAAREKGESVDYLTFVPDGEPTLDSDLGVCLDLVRPFGVKTAVITNGSLLWMSGVREDLQKADLVSVKVDTVDEQFWRKTNRPHKSLRLNEILDGAVEFARAYGGTLITETMLVEGVNDGEDTVEETAVFLAGLNPKVAYISIPTRPPAETWVAPPPEGALNRAYQVIAAHVPAVEYLIGYEGDGFANTGNVSDDILSITSVHPMRRSAVVEFLSNAGEDWDVIDKLMASGRLLETSYRGEKFYLRNLKGERMR